MIRPKVTIAVTGFDLKSLSPVMASLVYDSEAMTRAIVEARKRGAVVVQVRFQHSAQQQMALKDAKGGPND